MTSARKSETMRFFICCFLLVIFSARYINAFRPCCPRLPSGRGGGRGPAWPLPPLWKADGLRSDRQGLAKIRVLRVPSTRKNAGHPPARKTSECRKNKAPTLPSPETSARTLALSISHTERAPAVVGPPPCKSPASRHGAFAPRLPPTFSGLASQWLTFVTQLSPLRCILAPTVPFAWGSCAPFLSKLPPDRARSLRRQPHSILGPLFTYPGRPTHCKSL